MTYCPHQDFAASYTLALHWLALRIGSRRFATLPEMYWIETTGGIP